MRKKFALSAALLILTGLGLAFAGAAEKKPDASKAAAAVQENPKAGEFKDILFKLVRQDEYLDETLDTLGPSARLNAHDISALGLSLKLIAGNLNRVSAMNKTEFASAQPGSANLKYVNAILSYSRKVDRKAGKVSALVARMAAKNKKTAMRDAVGAGKGGKKSRGKKITQILEEQKAMKTLAGDVRNLRAASRGLAATSKWLYISSK